MIEDIFLCAAILLTCFFMFLGGYFYRVAKEKTECQNDTPKDQ